MDLIAINRRIKEIKFKPAEADLDKKNLPHDPFTLFLTWFDQALTEEPYDPSAMVLTTVDTQHRPDARVVLLKELQWQGFIFYTNYDSQKGQQLARQNTATLLFYWPRSMRQIKIKGDVRKLNKSQNEAYFATRPRPAQISAHVSKQSQVMPQDEDVKAEIAFYEKKFAVGVVPCPDHWGGYILKAHEYEFFQGKAARMHTRIVYFKESTGWVIKQLFP